MSREAVKVVVRCRPLNSTETKDGRGKIVDMDVQEGMVMIRNPKSDASEAPKQFTFDQVYDDKCLQQDIFDITARPIVDSVLEGYNGTIFAYGQTGTGKSHTMEGKEEPASLRGIIPNTFHYVFDQIASKAANSEFLVRASYLEIYNEDIRDLLSKDISRKLELKENAEKAVYVKDLSEFIVKGYADINNVLLQGRKNRMTGSTLMNAESSRSHSIFTITIEATSKMTAATAAGADDDNHIRVGKCNLVDLAGSERQSKTGASGDRLKEGIKINMSLTALGNVISSLVDSKGGHVPYRDSKLTRLLQDSLGGNTKTVMVANIGPADWNYDETMSTLRYANRAKNIQNKPKINEDPKDAMLREFQDEISKLKAALSAKIGNTPGAPSRVVERSVEVEDDVEVIKAQMRADMEAQMQQDLSAEALKLARVEAEAQARVQLEAVIADTGRSEQQRKSARDALKRSAAEAASIAAAMEEEAKQKQALEEKIKAMESKLLQGGVNLLDKVDELKSRSEDTKRELAVRKRQEEEQKRRLLELEDKQMDVNQRFGSIEEEIQVKSRQLKKLFEKYQAKKSETSDVQEQFQREREGVLEDYRILTQQIKLKNLIIACFIPPDHQDLIMKHCQWQDYEATWNVEYITMSSVAQTAQPRGGKLGARGASREDNDKLANIYFNYTAMDGSDANGVSASSGGRPGTASKGRPRSSTGRPQSGIGAAGVPQSARKGRGSSTGGPSKDATNIGTLRDSVNWGPDESKSLSKALPKARGLVKDTVDPRLRLSVAR
ncbi:MAG: hypothetical protein WDW38_000672 [Sanguina aurantia]